MTYYTQCKKIGVNTVKGVKIDGEIKLKKIQRMMNYLIQKSWYGPKIFEAGCYY